MRIHRITLAVRFADHNNSSLSIFLSSVLAWTLQTGQYTERVSLEAAVSAKAQQRIHKSAMFIRLLSRKVFWMPFRCKPRHQCTVCIDCLHRHLRPIGFWLDKRAQRDRQRRERARCKSAGSRTTEKWPTNPDCALINGDWRGIAKLIDQSSTSQGVKALAIYVGDGSFGSAATRSTTGSQWSRSNTVGGPVWMSGEMRMTDGHSCLRSDLKWWWSLLECGAGTREWFFQLVDKRAFVSRSHSSRYWFLALISSSQCREIVDVEIPLTCGSFRANKSESTSSILPVTAAQPSSDSLLLHAELLRLVLPWFVYSSIHSCSGEWTVS
jgi:hypothetical protein